jgi:hypothetical protein
MDEVLSKHYGVEANNDLYLKYLKLSAFQNFDENSIIFLSDDKVTRENPKDTLLYLIYNAIENGSAKSM